MVQNTDLPRAVRAAIVDQYRAQLEMVTAGAMTSRVGAERVAIRKRNGGVGFRCPDTMFDGFRSAQMLSSADSEVVPFFPEFRLQHDSGFDPLAPSPSHGDVLSSFASSPSGPHSSSGAAANSKSMPASGIAQSAPPTDSSIACRLSGVASFSASLRDDEKLSLEPETRGLLLDEDGDSELVDSAVEAVEDPARPLLVAATSTSMLGRSHSLTFMPFILNVLVSAYNQAFCEDVLWILEDVLGEWLPVHQMLLGLDGSWTMTVRECSLLLTVEHEIWTQLLDPCHRVDADAALSVGAGLRASLSQFLRRMRFDGQAGSRTCRGPYLSCVKQEGFIFAGGVAAQRISERTLAGVYAQCYEHFAQQQPVERALDVPLRVAQAVRVAESERESMHIDTPLC